ncbi:MAG: iron-containing alcohol dehydrogenase [Oscillospiraceae bacterium]|nr:iron-containing alcohol dehydrogenase [Oscillospiraceae bacterium]
MQTNSAKALWIQVIRSAFFAFVGTGRLSPSPGAAGRADAGTKGAGKLMKDFIFKMPTRVIFGVGAAARLHEVCRSFGAKKVFVVSDKIIGATEEFKKLLAALEKNGMPFEVYTDTLPEPPAPTVDAAAAALKASGCDMVAAVGGGSPIDTAKAIAMLATNPGGIGEYLFGGSRTVENPPLPVVAIPTTAGSGSEVTGASVIEDVEKHVKLSVTHDSLIPRVAIVDPLMHRSMPGPVTAATGMDALTHAIEAYTSLNANPMSDALARQTIRLVGENIRAAFSNPADLEARGNMALASLLGAASFVNGGLGAVHGISQSMGGVAHVSHGVGNALLLPHVMERNCVGNLKKFADIAGLLGEKTEGLPLREAAELSVKAVRSLNRDLQIPPSLREVGVAREMFPAILKGTMAYRMLAINPCVLTERDVSAILEAAY